MVSFRVVWILLFAPLLLLQQACSEDQPVRVHVGSATASVEIALTAEARSIGLMHREALGENHGVLLVMPRPQVVRMWMLNTRIPLDAGFFDRDGRLVNYVSMEQDGGKKIHRSAVPALYALEMNKGWFERHGIQTGDTLQLPYPVVGE